LAATALCSSPSVEAATIYVAAGDDLQSALNAARPGDTVVLQANAEFVGNFVLPVKSGDAWITVRTSTADSSLPPAGYRIKPGDAALLARLRSPNADPALRTAPGAHHWVLRYLEFRANQSGLNDLIQIGDGSSAQNSMTLVPHHISLDHVYVHGDRYVGQKRCIALNAGNVTIRDSHISDCKGVGQDTQAICGWNGPGPYTIENNYLEAAGENVMFGGADPAIRDLVADGITVRRNHFSRPMSWRDPILSPPEGPSASAVSGGSLPAGVYGYRVVAKRAIQITVATSTASAEATVTTTGEGAVRVRWQAVAGASEYWVFGRTAGGQGQYWIVSTTEFIDTGAPGTSGAAPTSATVWSVKNIFELKNARNVVVENNILENHWRQAQPGWAIVLTPRNSQGTCVWCEVRNVRFEGNLVQNVAAGINILGFDNGNPSGQAAGITVKQNVFRLSTALGGNASFMQMGDRPRDIKIEHNTIDGNGNAVLTVYGGSSTSPAAVYGFEFLSNAARHGLYGINGAYFSYGLGILNTFFPGYVWKTNYLAGAPVSRYPPSPDTLVQTPFENQFVNSAAGDYTLREGSPLEGAASDGTDIGADYPALRAALGGVKEGVPPGPELPLPDPPLAAFSVSCQSLVCTFTSTSTQGSAAIGSLSWNFGDGGTAIGSPVGRTYAAPGTYTVTLTAADVNGGFDTESKAVTVTAVPPTAGLTVSCSGLTCNFSDASSPGTGAISSRSWTFGDGTPAIQAVSGTHTFATGGTYPITLTVTDIYGTSSSATETVTVAAASNRVHVAYSGVTTKWSSPSGATNYWSATITAVLHDTGERPIAGATVTAAWTGAVVKTSTCVTDVAGKCVLKSGTLSYGRSWVTLNVTTVVAPGTLYDPTANHTQSGTRTATITLNRP
jgi:PKD repeat protein